MEPMHTRRSEDEHVRAVLGALLGPVRSVASLPPGVGGESYLVEAGAGRFVAKFFAADVQRLVGPAEQYALLESLAPAGLAPAPAAFDADAGLLVTVFVADAAAVPPAELRRPARIREVAALLERLHALDAELPRFAPAAYAERYLERIGGRAALSPQNRGRYDELLDLGGIMTDEPVCLCHNDLIADNVLLGDEPKLIDFDYAVTAPAVLDLASLAFMNEFSDDEAAGLIDVYFKGRAPISLTDFARVRRLVRLLAHFWSLASAEVEPAIVAQYGIEDD